jgi:hypothetical protein
MRKKVSGHMHDGKPLHHIADDRQRAALIRLAVHKGVDQARGDFFHVLLMEGLDDGSLALFAREEWDVFTRHVAFDYPRYAQTLFLQAYRSAYRAHLSGLAHGRPASTSELVAAIEEEIGLGPAAAGHSGGEPRAVD